MIDKMKTHFMKVYREHPILLSAFIAFSALDIITTYVALGMGAKEVNPAMRYIIHNYGFGALTAFRIGIVSSVIYGKPVSDYVDERRNSKSLSPRLKDFFNENFYEIVLSFGAFVTGATVLSNFITIGAILL